MPKVNVTANGFKIQKGPTEIKQDDVASRGKKSNRTDTERIERCELMLELICDKLGIRI